MWQQSSDSRYLYKLQSGEFGYELLVTDLEQVYCETLSMIGITHRGEDKEFALDNEPQIAKFCSMLCERLGSTDAHFDLPIIRVESMDHTAVLSWEFHLAPLNPVQSILVLRLIIKGLLGTVNNLGDTLFTTQRRINEKNQVIRGLHEAVQRRVEYRAPRHLNAAYKEREILLLDEQPDAIKFVNQYWPHELESAVLVNQMTSSNEVKIGEDVRVEPVDLQVHTPTDLQIVEQRQVPRADSEATMDFSDGVISETDSESTI